MNKKVYWAGWVVSVLVSGLFAFSGISKVFYQKMYPQMPEQMAAIGLPMTILTTITVLEILCTLIYLVPTTAVLGAVLLTGYLGGAILTHLRVGQPVFMHIIIGGLVWLGIYLREPRLHALLPFRKQTPG